MEVSDQSIRRWVKAGELKAYKPKKEYRIAASDLHEFLEGRAVPLVQTPLPELPEKRREAIDVALDAARRQAAQDIQAINRTLASEQPQTYFKHHENEAIPRLLQHPKDELAGALIEIAVGYVQLERRAVQLEEQLQQTAQTTAAEEAAEETRSNSA